MIDEKKFEERVQTLREMAAAYRRRADRNWEAGRSPAALLNQGKSDAFFLAVEIMRGESFAEKAADEIVKGSEVKR